MITIRKLDYQSYARTVDNRSRVTAELFVDEASDLPGTEGIDGYTLCMGSIAYVVRTGELYVLGSDGKWYGGEKEDEENGS